MSIPQLTPDLIANFIATFAGGVQCHGQWHPSKPKPETINCAATESTWHDHLRGVIRLGQSPIRPDGMCWFGLLDIDQHQTDLPKPDLALFTRRIVERGLPLIAFRSKRGGLHIYVFLDAPVSARQLREALKAYAAEFADLTTGFGVEIFPKQDAVTKAGNWVNVPYFGAATGETTTYALDAHAQPLGLEEAIHQIFVRRILPLHLPVAKLFAEPIVANEPDAHVKLTKAEEWYQRAMTVGLHDNERNDGFKAIFGLFARQARGNAAETEDTFVERCAEFSSARDAEPDKGEWTEEKARTLATNIWRNDQKVRPEPTAQRNILSFKLLTRADLAEVPPIEWLIDGILPMDAFAFLWGKPGVGKTFTAVDFEACIASGRSWNGRAVRQGPVVHVAGEGSRAFGERVEAWELKYNGGEPVRDLFTLPFNVPMLDRDAVDAFASQIAEQIAEVTGGRTPSLITFDTLARNTPGGNENDTKDMNLFVAHADLLRLRYFPNVTTLTLHHPAKLGDYMRGSTVLNGAAAMSLKQSQDDSGVIAIECDKAQNSEKFAPVHLRLEKTGDSAVLVSADAPLPEVKPSVLETPTGKKVMAVLTAGPMTYSDWLEASDCTASTFKRYRTEAIKQGRVIQEGKVFRKATPAEIKAFEDALADAPFGPGKVAS